MLSVGARFFVTNMLYYTLMGKPKLKDVMNNSLAKSVEKRRDQNRLKKIESFNFENLVRKFRGVIEGFPDMRTGGNTRKKLPDAALGAFSVFYTQSPSFLFYQMSMEKSNGANNASSFFGVEDIISDSHIRRLLDVVSPSYVFPMFRTILDGLDANGRLSEFRSYNKNLAIALDGVQYHASDSIYCDQCSRKVHKNGNTTYSHTAITPVVVKPGNNKVISLVPEFIRPQDGHKKQD